MGNSKLYKENKKVRAIIVNSISKNDKEVINVANKKWTQVIKINNLKEEIRIVSDAEIYKSPHNIRNCYWSM